MAEQKRPADQRRLAAYLKHKGASLPKAEDSSRQVPIEKPSSDKEPVISAPVQGPIPGTIGLVKTVTPETAKSGSAEAAVQGTGRESKYRRVAKLLIVIGQKAATEILSKLDPEQIEGITKEITRIRTVSKEEGEAVLAEFRALFSDALHYTGRTSPERGGVDVARQLLHHAFGQEKGEALLRRAVPDAIENPFQFLEDFRGEQISFLLKDETAPVISLVFSRLSPQKAAECIKQLAPARRLDVLKRLAKMGKTSPDVVEKVAEALRERAHKIGKTETTEIDGKAALAAILRYADPSLGDLILDDLEELNPNLSREIKEKLYTLEDVLRCDDRALQEKLRTMENRDIALLLKGQKPAFIDKIKSNLSANRRTLIEEERELLGPVPRKEIEGVVQDFLSWFRQGKEAGTILLSDDEDIVV